VKEEIVSFQSAGLRLHGALGVPDGLPATERRAAFLVLHGFGSNSDSANVLQPTRLLSEFG
jgi:poly(3-hydroxybutyrate) depolymerase